MDIKKWNEIPLNLRNISLSPLMYIGHSLFIKIPQSKGKGELSYVSTLVHFDKCFLSYYIGELLKKLIPLKPDKVENICHEALEYYRQEWEIYAAKNGLDKKIDNEDAEPGVSQHE